MKKNIAAFLTAFLCMVLFSPVASATNQIPEMEIEVTLQIVF